MKNPDQFIKYERTVPFEAFLQKVETQSMSNMFTEEELVLYGKQVQPKSLAVRWLTKEILIEHYREGLNFQMISITGLPSGKPVITINNNDIPDKIHISLSHSKNYISCLVIIEQPCS